MILPGSFLLKLFIKQLNIVPVILPHLVLKYLIIIVEAGYLLSIWPDHFMKIW